MKRSIWISTIVAVGALGLSATAPASGGGGSNDVRRAGECTGASTSKIKVKPDDGALEVEFEVDQNRNDVSWRVRIKDNAKLVFRGTRRTKGPSGSFTVRKRIPNLAGTDQVKGLARNPQSGERCAAKVSI
jgi:hypothetical protein